jgi:hypothetical protein
VKGGWVAYQPPDWMILSTERRTAVGLYVQGSTEEKLRQDTRRADMWEVADDSECEDDA